MITRQILHPNDSLLRFQRSDDGFFNATTLLNEWNHNHLGNEQKPMAGYLRIQSTKEYVTFLEEKYDVKKAVISSKKGTWMHPHLFIDFAMWISLEFKDMVIMWVKDGLLFQRNQAGDNATLLASTIMQRYIEFHGVKPAPMIYMNEFKQLKEFVGIIERNTATEQQLQTLNVLQKLDIKLIKEQVGKVSRYKQLKQLAEALQ